MASFTNEEVYGAIKDFIRTKHYSPTIQELADNLYTSSLTAINIIVKRLKEIKMIDFEDGKSRSISLVEDNNAFKKLDEIRYYIENNANANVGHILDILNEKDV